MYIQFYFAVFISAAAFAALENSEDGLHIVAIAKANVGVVGGRKNQTDERAKRAVSASDRDTILDTFNYQRSLVGASDMNYLSWSSSLENDVNNYIKDCDLDARFRSSAKNNVVFKKVSSRSDDHKSAVEYFFTTSTFTNSATSRYLMEVGGGYTYCRSARFERHTLYQVHLYVYAILTTSDFSYSYSQYTRGDACTRCGYGLNWCYNKLCREDCTCSTSGCCPIMSRIPDQCKSPSPKCGSSSTEIKASVMMATMVSALRYYFL